MLPATDIVAEVAQAADPKRLQAAMRRLGASPSSADLQKESFEASLKDIRPSQASLSNRITEPRLNPTSNSKMGISEAAQRFEAFLLQSFLETLLPKNDHAFGQGTAGGIWRSMTAEQLGAQLAKHGVVGLDRIFEKQFGLENLEAQANRGAA